MTGASGHPTHNRLVRASVTTSVQAGTIHGLQVHTPPPPAPLIPRELPPVPATWMDRADALRVLDRIAAARPDGSSTLVVLCGVGGVGKTALATKWLTGRADTPGGQFYADVTSTGRDPISAARRVLPRFLRALNHEPPTDDPEELTAWWRSASHGRRLGMLLDNTTCAEQVLPLLPGGPGHLVVVTSREPLRGLRGHGANEYELMPLEPAVATRLLARYVGDELARGEQQALETIAARCTYLPLALVLAAAGLAKDSTRSPSAVARDLTRITLCTPHLEGGRAVNNVLERRYVDLPRYEARSYRILAVLPVAELEADAAAVALGLSTEEAALMLRRFAETRLLEPLGPRSGRGQCYRFHDGLRPRVRRWAVEQEGSRGDNERAIRRYGDWLLATFTQAERILTPHHRRLDRELSSTVQVRPFSDDDQEQAALAWVEAHQDDLDLMVREARSRQWPALLWQLVHAAWCLFHRLGLLELSYALHCLGVEAAEACGDDLALREMLTTGAIALRGLNRFEEAERWARRALDSAQRDRDQRAIAQATQELALCAKANGDRESAAALLKQALTIRSNIADRRAAALTCIVQAEMDLEDKCARRAIDRAGPAHVALRDEGDRLNAGRALLILARAYVFLGANIRDLLDVAEDDFTTTGSLRGQVRVQRIRGDLAVEAGELAGAREHYSAALALAERISPADAEELAQRLNALAEPTSSG